MESDNLTQAENHVLTVRETQINSICGLLASLVSYWCVFYRNQPGHELQGW